MVAVIGPTASGKTWLSAQLAKRFNGEIISADSMQIYKDMHIATAKPDESEKEGIPHHLMDFLDLEEEYSVARYVLDAKKAVEDIKSRDKLPILTGGTGLYVDSFLDDIKFSEQSDDTEIRQALKIRLENEGADALYKELTGIDPESAEAIHVNNTKRLVRALEVYYSTGITLTEQKKRSRMKNSPYNAVYIGLKCADRERLYERINKRVDLMLEKGLLDEAKRILARPLGKTACMAIGYKELSPYINGEMSLDEAVENLKRETRRYAKRQLTWFMRNERINWINTDEYDTPDAILEKATEFLQERGYKRTWY